MQHTVPFILVFCSLYFVLLEVLAPKDLSDHNDVKFETQVISSPHPPPLPDLDINQHMLLPPIHEDKMKCSIQLIGNYLDDNRPKKYIGENYRMSRRRESHADLALSVDFSQAFVLDSSTFIPFMITNYDPDSVSIGYQNYMYMWAYSTHAPVVVEAEVPFCATNELWATIPPNQQLIGYCAFRSNNAILDSSLYFKLAWHRSRNSDPETPLNKVTNRISGLIATRRSCDDRLLQRLSPSANTRRHQYRNVDHSFGGGR